MSGSCWEALPVVLEWSGDSLGCPGASSGFPIVVGWPFWMSGSGQETILNIRE